MLTPKQEQKYWRTWAKILACQGWAHETSAKKDQRRYATHIMCGLKSEDGTARSMKSFVNRDFSRWLAATAHLCDEVEVRDRDRENSVWRIRQDARAAGLSDEYLAAIARDVFGTNDWCGLPGDQLIKFRNTIHNRAGSHTGHDTRTEAPAQPRRKYTLDGGSRSFSSPAQDSTTLKEERPMTTRRIKPATVTGPIPVVPPSRPLGYCMHAVNPPTAAPSPARGLPADIIINEVAHFADPEDEPF